MKPSEFHRDRNSYINEYIRFADAKAGAVLSFMSALMGAIGFLTQEVLKATTIAPPPWLSLPKAAFILTGGCLLLIVVVAAIMVTLRCMKALDPRLSPAHKSLASFPDISTQNASGLTELIGVMASDENAVAEEYAKHNIVISLVAMDKFRAISSSIAWLRAMVIAALVFLVFCVVTRGIFPSSP